MDKEDKHKELLLRAAGAAEWEYCKQSKELFLFSDWAEKLGLHIEQSTQTPVDTFMQYCYEQDRLAFFEALDAYRPLTVTGECFEFLFRFEDSVQGRRWLLARGNIINAEERCISGIILDITQRRILEEQLSQVGRLESIGQLAAGIAHEINTPMQYIGDNLNYLHKAQKQINSFWNEITEAANNNCITAETIEMLNNNLKVPRLMDEMPGAISDALEGVTAVTRIIRAMKDFSHPESDTKISCNINQIVQNAVTMSRHEWKYVADIECAFEETLPAIQAFPGELNQVFLNLIINAAQALEDKYSVTKTKGIISIRTRDNKSKSGIEIEVQDTAFGMNAETIKRIFDPFFTTKEVGKGTGQGLSICHSIITTRHAGTIRVESVPGSGSSFFIYLPIETISQHDSEKPQPQTL